MGIDLHMHTNASDGSDDMQGLLENLKNANITTFAITDHDTIAAALEVEKQVPENVKYIKGVEFSCITPAGKCHILGYDYDATNKVFLDALQMGMDLRLAKLQARMDYLKTKYDVSFAKDEIDWLQSQNAPGKPHLAQLLVKRGMGDTIGEAIQIYLNGCKDGAETRIPGEVAVNSILHAGGIPIWAHPLGGEGEKHLSEDAFEMQLQELLSYGIKGLECYYSRYTKEEITFLKIQANKYNLLISGGSDYHGTRKNILLGTLNAEQELIKENEITILQNL